MLVSQDTNIAAFRNLKGAIEFLQNRSGGTIYVQPGVYCGERNRELSWIPLNTVDLQEECHIRIRAFEPHTAVIDCENLGSAFVFDAEGLQESYTGEDEISGLIIQNSPQAIRIHNGYPVIRNNIIENCTIPQGLENAHGTGLFCLSGAQIENNIFRNNTGNWNGDDVSTYTYGGAIYINNETSDPS